MAPISGARAIQLVTGLARKVTPIAAATNAVTPMAPAVSQGGTPRCAASLTTGASVTPITTAATIGHERRAKTERQIPQQMMKDPEGAIWGGGAQMSTSVS